ncbi:MAG: aminopeptidase P family protein [Syntrophobacterales bacterium]|nr:MAG: aminopeptidase P family protein [Syntrophobacterales bacterium]
MRQERINRINGILGDGNLDGILITSLENVHYLSEFTGSDAALVMTENKGYFLTDSRYTTQAREEVLGFEIIEYQKKIEGLSNIMNDLGLRSIGFEPQNVTYGTHKELVEKVSGGQFIPINERVKNLRAVKDDEEIGRMKRAIDIASNSLRENIWRITPGTQEREIALELEFSMRRNGTDNIAFDTIVASGERSALPHGKPSEKRINRGDLITIDFGARYRGYYSDETCTFLCGKPNRRQREVYQIVKEAHDRAIASIRPGMKAMEVDSFARNWIREAGYGAYFGHGIGHGVGLAVHENPVIGPESKDVVEERMIFTIEPGIYIPGWGGMRIEDMVLVTEKGCEVLTSLSKEMEVIG